MTIKINCDSCGNECSRELYCNGCSSDGEYECDCQRSNAVNELRRWISDNRSSITSIERDLLLAVADNMVNSSCVFVAP